MLQGIVKGHPQAAVYTHLFRLQNGVISRLLADELFNHTPIISSCSRLWYRHHRRRHLLLLLWRRCHVRAFLLLLLLLPIEPASRLWLLLLLLLGCRCFICKGCVAAPSAARATGWPAA